MIKELEIGIELENIFQITEEYLLKNKEKIWEKRPPVRHKKEAKKGNK